MTSLDKFNALKRRSESLKRKASESLGAKQQLLKRLKDEYGFDSIEEAEKALASLREEVAAEELSLNTAIDEFETKHGATLSA